MAVVATRPIFPGEGSPHDGFGQAGFADPMAPSHHGPALHSDPGAILVHPAPGMNQHQGNSPSFPMYAGAPHSHSFSTPARHAPPPPALAPVGRVPEADTITRLPSDATWSQPRKEAVTEQQTEAAEGGDAPVDPTPKRQRGSYRCRRCGQPKKGHTCLQQPAATDAGTGSSPSGPMYGTPGSADMPTAGTPLSAGGAMMPQGATASLPHSAMGSTGQQRQAMSTPGSTVHGPHPGGAHTHPHAPGYQSPHPGAALLGCAVSEAGGKARPSAAALGIQPTRLAGLGMSPNPGPTMAGPQNSLHLSHHQQHHQQLHPQHHSQQHHQQVSPGGGAIGDGSAHQRLQPGAGMNAQWSSAKPASFNGLVAPTSSSLQGGPYHSHHSQHQGAQGHSNVMHAMGAEQHQHQQHQEMQQNSLQCGALNAGPADSMETSQNHMSTSPMTVAGTPAHGQGPPGAQASAHLLRTQHLCTPSSTTTPSSAFTPSTATTTSTDFSGAAAIGLVTPSPAPSMSGASIASVLHRVLSMSALAQPPVFDEYGIPRSASFAAPFSSPSGTETSDAQDGAGPESAQKDKPKPELVKRSEQDMCMVNILAKLLPQDLMAAAQCCRRWRRLAADVWFSVESAALVLDETKRPSEYVPFLLRKSPRLAHLTLYTRRWVIDDHLLLRIASERPSLVSLVIRPEADIDCRITEFGLSAFVRGCRLLEKVEIGNSFRMGGVQLQSHSLRSLTLLASTSLSTRFSLACPALLELSLSFFSASARVPVQGAEALAQPPRQPVPCAWDAISPGALPFASPAAGTSSDCPKKAQMEGIQEATALAPPAFGEGRANPGTPPAPASEGAQGQGQGELAMADAEGENIEGGNAGGGLALMATCTGQEHNEEHQGEEEEEDEEEEEEEDEKLRLEREAQRKRQEQALCLRALPQHASPRRVNAVLQQVANMSNPLKRLHVAALHTSDLMVSGLMAAHAQSLRALSLTHSQLLTDEGVKLISSCCKQLEFLDVSGCSKLTDKSLVHLSSQSQSSLSRLLVAACRRLTAGGVEKAVASLPNLALLDLGHVFVSEDQFGSSGASLPFTPESIKGVRRFGQLQEVNPAIVAAQAGSRARLGGKENASPKLMIWGNSFLGPQMTPQKRKGAEGNDREGAAEEAASTCTVRMRSTSLRQLSLWGCSAVQGLDLQCSELRELNLNCCPALATAASGDQLRSTCPSLRSIHTETGGIAGSDGAEDEEDVEDEDYEEGDGY